MVCSAVRKYQRMWKCFEMKVGQKLNYCSQTLKGVLVRTRKRGITENQASQRSHERQEQHAGSRTVRTIPAGCQLGAGNPVTESPEEGEPHYKVAGLVLRF